MSRQATLSPGLGDANDRASLCCPSLPHQQRAWGQTGFEQGGPGIMTHSCLDGNTQIPVHPTTFFFR